MMGKIIIYSLIVYIVVWLGIQLIRRFDDSPWEITHREKCVLPIVSGLNGMLLLGISLLGNTQLKEKEMIFLALFAGCLLFTCITDVKKYVVFQFTWWVAAVILGMWFVEKTVQYECAGDLIKVNALIPSKLCELVVYILLQEFFFCRMYGRADCHGFSLCAVALSLCGINMSGYTHHMAIAFGILGAVQLCKKNVNRKGNLKEPAAFLPYITMAFWIRLYIAFFPK